MTEPAAGDLRAWVSDQIDRYAALHPTYERFAEVLGTVLRRAAGRIAPLAIVQVRAKSVPSFAEKAIRKRATRPDPVTMFTDLCGARVIGRTRSEVDAMCRFVVDHFDIDWENSLDASERLRPSEFGYRSIHYIVSFRRDVDYGVEIPEDLVGLKAEAQLRTVAEHAYSDFGHDLSYKGAFALPVEWERELAGASAVLEEVDHIFSRIEEGMRAYRSSYGRYFGEAEARAEVERLRVILDHDERDAELADRVARLATALGDWPLIVEVLEPFATDDPAACPPPLLRELGNAFCQLYSDQPTGEGYRRGQRYLELAGASDDIEALCALGGTWKRLDEERARGLYRRAFELDPAHPYALGNFLELELGRQPALLASVRPLLERGIERCRQHIAAGINLPWAQFDLGRFLLLSDEPYEALTAYADGIGHSTAPFMIETTVRSLDRLSAALADRPGFEWARRLLLLGLACRFGAETARAAIRGLATDAPPLAEPVVIVAGGTDPRLATEMAAFAGLLEAGFEGFDGTVISGGTTQGISGLVGDVGRAAGDRLRTVGYLPGLIPSDASPDTDYDELRRTPGHGFSPLEPLQNWIDIVTCAVDPATVRVLGINGGRIAALEYRIALALGATVGLVADSGREAGRLLRAGADPVPRLIRLPQDGETIRAFLAPAVPPSAPAVRETLGRAVHEAYREERLRTDWGRDPALAPWETLADDLRSSSLGQADQIVAKLERIGCAIAPAGAPGEPVAMTEADIERLAEMEHGRWTAERLLAGWRLGDRRDAARRLSPYLVEWAALPDEVRELDRQAVRRIPVLLAAVGLKIARTAP
jgi:ppGpp synthetase/RelA/SpoT-type nucleotidyltranferase